MNFDLHGVRPSFVTATLLVACAVLPFTPALVSCGGENRMSGVADAKLPTGTRTKPIEHEACDEAGNRVELLDANGDGKPDIRRVYDKAQREVCRITDLNRDGKPDLFEYFGPNGEVRRREASFEDTGVVNAIDYFENGKLVRRELDTTGQRKVDTYDYFDPATGLRTKRERDSNADGKVDQWWTWDKDRLTILLDKDGDGKADPDATVAFGGDKAPASSASAAPTTPPRAEPEAIQTPDGGGLAPPAPEPSATAAPAPSASASAAKGSTK
ncbi:MAG: hypothetical protein U0169_14255 [Polyangiaceae bacterium]